MTTGLDERAVELYEADLATLQASAPVWEATPAGARADLLDQVQAATAAVAGRWVRTAVDVKGLDPGSPLVGEEWMSGPYALLRALAAYARTLRRIAAGTDPLAGLRLHPDRSGRRVVVPILPEDLRESLLLHGFRGEVWLRPGVGEASARRGAGLASRHGGGGGVGLVLGAGNITSIPPLDALYELLAHDRVVLLKLNPVMAPMLTVYRAAFEPLMRVGALRIVQGGPVEGEFLTGHDGVDHVHITGSARTHDAIVWGTGEEATRRRVANDPKLTVPITSELGGVSPVIVVPGEWSRADLRFQAEHVVTQRLHNNGNNCIAGQVVLLGRDWPQREAFILELARALNRAPARPDWYPGTGTRVDEACASYPSAQREGSRLLVDLRDQDPTAMETTEYFAPVLGILDVPGLGADFLTAAVDLANDELVGTLGANVIVDPADRRALGPAFDRAIERLRYGTIAVNTWTALGFLTPTAPWGAYPGDTLQATQSGIGVVHNAFLLADTEKTVVEGPFRPFPRSILHGELSLFPKPPWFVTARSAATTGRRLTQYAAAPSWAKLPAIFAAAFRA